MIWLLPANGFVRNVSGSSKIAGKLAFSDREVRKLLCLNKLHCRRSTLGCGNVVQQRKSCPKNEDDKYIEVDTSRSSDCFCICITYLAVQSGTEAVSELLFPAHLFAMQLRSDAIFSLRHPAIKRRIMFDFFRSVL